MHKRNNPYLRLFSAVMLLLCVSSIQAQDRLYADEFPLGDVTLLDGPMKKARDLNIKTLLQYDCDRLLAPYLKEAGLTPKGKSYPNWDGLDGHVADMYIPKNADGKLPAVAVCGPFGAVKEQCSGLYAQTLAERGFLTIAFDPSFTGESGGQPRYMASPDINTEDFQSAVDFLSVQDNVDPDRIGICGICGWGGLSINTAAIDTRIKATVAVTMYDMARVNANGYFDSEDSEEKRYEKKQALNAQRISDYASGEYALGGGVVDPLPDDAPFFVKDYHSYYKTERGYHPRSLNSNGGWNTVGCMSFMNQPINTYSNEIRSAVLLIHGDKAHSCYFSKDAYAAMTKDSKYADNKELLIIPDAVHTDLYDGGENKVIPFDKIESFYKENLK